MRRVHTLAAARQRTNAGHALDLPLGRQLQGGKQADQAQVWPRRAVPP